jgi:hypothetical protein
VKVETQICLEPKGKWHRRVGDGTQCGKSIAGSFMSRDWVLDDKLCESCFTARERLLVLAEKIQQANEAEANPALYYSPEDAPTDVEVVDDDFNVEGPTDVG